MYSKLLQVLTETTTNHSDNLTEISKMTLDEFMDYRNKSGKSHDEDSYNPTLKSLNRVYNIRQIVYKDSDGVSIYENPYAYFLIKSGNVEAIIDKNTNIIYYKADVVKKVHDNYTYMDYKFGKSVTIMDVKISKKVSVKYMAELIAKYIKEAEDNIASYPVVLGHKIFDGERFTIRSEARIEKVNQGITMVVVNDNLKIVAQASDEWGATLIQVAKEYKGKGIGKYLGKLWYSHNPKFTSGGFTAAGYHNAKSIWADSVRKSLSQGRYSEWVKNGTMSIERVKEIVNSAKQISSSIISSDISKISTDVVSKENKKEDYLIYNDGVGILIFDKILLTDFDSNSENIEDYIYAYGFLRSDVYEKTFIYSFDYNNEEYRLKLLYCLLQLAKDNGETITTNSEGAANIGDYNSLKYVDIKDSGRSKGRFVNFELTQNVIDLDKYNAIVSSMLRKYDPYNEAFYQILEIANSKWDSEHEWKY